MLNQVMSATRGATDAFSGVSRHVNTSVKNAVTNLLLPVHFDFAVMKIFICCILFYTVEEVGSQEY